MKTRNNFLKNLSKVVLVLSVLFITSCGSDDDGVVADAFVTLPTDLLTTYNGELTYTPGDGMGIVAGVDGTATISGSGSTYTISFSDGVPSLTGLRFIGNGNGSYASVATDGSSAGISIESDELRIGARVGSDSWGFVPN
ncbi:hypothetical protein [uncultured Aquimarina sp.]|uniref:hypothetical protein n=1 Tax=uncultured Aquimarina sp. TaxID=575652 RepID=UPI002615BB44|nr:hypothetical protein [uncultured Aquimarina sp.]